MTWGDGELLVFGGHRGGGPPGPDSRHADGVAYDPADDTWQRLADLPVARPSWDGVDADGVVYALGSRLQPAGLEEETGDEPPAFLAYVVDGDRWLERPDPPGGGRSNQALAWTGAELIVWGGQTSQGGPTPTGLRWDHPPDDQHRSGRSTWSNRIFSLAGDIPAVAAWCGTLRVAPQKPRSDRRPPMASVATKRGRRREGSLSRSPDRRGVSDGTGVEADDARGHRAGCRAAWTPRGAQ